jgi:outer membrane protein OmpA-like peptidoglycan-associated protein
MRISEFEDFDDIEHEALLSASEQRNWIWFGLFVSLGLHLALCFYFYRVRFQPAEAALVEPAQTATFTVKNVDLRSLDKASEDQNTAAAKPQPDHADTELPDEKKSFDKLLEEVRASSALPDDMRDVLPDKPKVDQPNANSVIKEIERTTAQTLSNDPSATREQSLLNESAVSGRPQPALSGTELATSTIVKRPNTFTGKIPADSAGPNKKGTYGFADLDQLLKQQGPLGSGTKIRMPDDELFAFDSAELQFDAGTRLQKLGTLIKRNPKATFTIEGYTDSIGYPEYNLDLSQRRADSVKQYLVNVMGINPAQIEARGYGASNFLMPPRLYGAAAASQAELDAEIQRQKLNRRVVIVVNTNER